MDAASVDTLFHAIAHPVRRAVIEQLGRGPRSVSALASPHDVALPTFVRHLQVLEGAGLVRSHKRGRVRTCELVPGAMAAGERWLAEQRALWERRLDQLDTFLIDNPEEVP